MKHFDPDEREIMLTLLEARNLGAAARLPKSEARVRLRKAGMIESYRSALVDGYGHPYRWRLTRAGYAAATGSGL